jgi:ankyrin repeat protein
VKWLVERGADINRRGKGRNAPAIGSNRRASALGNLALSPLEAAKPAMDFLIEHGAELKVAALIATLSPRRRNPALPVMKYLIDKGVDINEPDERYGTPLHHAIHVGKADMAKLLIESGADTTVVCFGQTPKQYAQEKNNKTIIALFS